MASIVWILRRSSRAKPKRLRNLKKKSLTNSNKKEINFCHRSKNVEIILERHLTFRQNQPFICAYISVRLHLGICTGTKSRIISKRSIVQLQFSLEQNLILRFFVQRVDRSFLNCEYPLRTSYRTLWSQYNNLFDAINKNSRYWSVLLNWLKH